MQKLFEDGDYQTLLKEVEISLSANIEMQITGLIYKSRMMAIMHKYEEGLADANEAIELSRNNHLDFLEIFSLIAKAYCCSRAHHVILTSTLSQLEILTENTKVPIEDQITQHIKGNIYFIHGWYLFNEGKPEIGREELEKSLIIRRLQADTYGLIEVLLYIGFTYIEYSGTPQVGLKNIEEAVSLAEQSGNKHMLGLSYNWYATLVSVVKGRYESLKIFQKGIEVYKQLGEMGENGLNALYNNIALTYRQMENYEKALEYQDLYLSWAEKHDILSALAFGTSNLSLTYFMINNFEKAIQYRKKSIIHAYKMNNKNFIAFFHQLLGVIYYSNGQLNLAEKEFLFVQKLRTELESSLTISRSGLELLHVYTLKMQTEKAFMKIKEILTELDNISNNNLRFAVYLLESMNYLTLGDIDHALKSLNESSKFWNKFPITGDIHHIHQGTNLLFQKILLMLEIGEISQAELYFEELESLTSKVKSKKIIIKRKFLNGLILKTKSRGRLKFQAQSIFQEIIEGDIIDLRVYSLSMLYLCDLLILEMKISDDPEMIIKELVLILNKMTKIGKNQEIPMLLVMCDIILGKIDLVHSDIESARSSFQRANIIAMEHNLHNLLSRVKNEQDFVDAEISKWRDQGMRYLSIKERVEKAQIHEYLTHAISVKEKLLDLS